MTRPKKRIRSDAEILAQSSVLEKDWIPGDIIDAWLRRHVDELTELVRDYGWSWSDIGRAMDMARINYGSGKPWTGPLLTQKISIARKKNAARKVAKSVPRASPSPVVQPELADALRAAMVSFIGGLATKAPQREVVDLQPAPVRAKAVPGTSELPHIPISEEAEAFTDEADDGPAPEQEFKIAKPRWTPPAAKPAVAEPSSSGRRDVDEEIARLQNRPKHGSIPMPSIPQPEDD